MEQKANVTKMQTAMGSFLMEQYKKKKAMENKQAAGLGAVARAITDFCKENFVGDIQVALYDAPKLFDQNESAESVQTWKKEDPLNVEDIVIKSENLAESPLN